MKHNWNWMDAVQLTTRIGQMAHHESMMLTFLTTKPGHQSHGVTQTSKPPVSAVSENQPSAIWKTYAN